jgi:hypothetical protein
MKKILSAALALSVMTGLLAFSASADTPALVSAEDIAVMSVEQIAYLDVETAAPAVQDAILEARSEIIYGDQAWTVNGAVSIIDSDGSTEKLPEFSELFPGWDLPERQVTPMDPAHCRSANSSDWPILANLSLKLASATTASQKFASFSGDGDPIYVYAVTTPRDGARFNIGFTDDNGNDKGWVPAVSETQQVELETSARIYYHVRASVPDTAYEGAYQLTVTDVKADDLKVVHPA